LARTPARWRSRQCSGPKELSMEFQDRVLKCVDCGSDFVFTAGEQLFFHDKQFRNEPKRCKNCKAKRVSVLGPSPSRPGHAKVETHAVCSQCSKETTVPFRPTQGRPILCRECFRERRQVASA
jgi:CxxC-x17-CxxC domain-containing protein